MNELLKHAPRKWELNNRMILRAELRFMHRMIIFKEKFKDYIGMQIKDIPISVRKQMIQFLKNIDEEYKTAINEILCIEEDSH